MLQCQRKPTSFLLGAMIVTCMQCLPYKEISYGCIKPMALLNAHLASLLNILSSVSAFGDQS